MSKSLRSMSEIERRAAIARRLASNTKGLGYWAAIDAVKKTGPGFVSFNLPGKSNGKGISKDAPGVPS